MNAEAIMTTHEVLAKAYCNCLALEKGLDPGGYAADFNTLALVEMPLPWKLSMYDQAGPLPQQIFDLFALWMQRYRETGVYSQRILLVAPDPAYSVPGHRRVMFYTRPAARMSAYAKVEYAIPEAQMGALVWALFEAPEQLEAFNAFRTPEADPTRDLLVCTHGTVDAACAKFGYPLYKELRRNHADERLRVWRVSHFGGHVFAPTLMDMPTGHYWAYVEQAQAHQIVTRSGDVAAMRGHYRGWAGVKSGFVQAAERELWQRHGWDWFAWAKSGETLAQDADEEKPAWAEVRIHAVAPDGAQHTYEMRVEVSQYIETITTTGNENTYQYPQYTVTRMERTS
jgi:hypothetical protein